jgi:hypothetical protein
MLINITVMIAQYFLAEIHQGVILGITLIQFISMCILREQMYEDWGEGIFMPTSDCIRGIFGTIKYGTLIAASVLIDFYINFWYQ